MRMRKPMMMRRRRWKDNDRNQCDTRLGVAVVEMAFVLPVFVMVVFGIVEFGRAMMVSQMVTSAAREATRLAIVDGSSNESVTEWIHAFLDDSLGINPSDVTVEITVDPAPGNVDPYDRIEDAKTRDLVMVQVFVQFDCVSYIPGNYLAGKNLSARNVMRRE